MKQSLLRFFAIAFFCLTSFAIKSETSACKTICPVANKTCISTKVVSADTEETDYKYEPFFIKL